jgi:hypothetical protein
VFHSQLPASPEFDELPWRQATSSRQVSEPPPVSRRDPTPPRSPIQPPLVSRRDGPAPPPRSPIQPQPKLRSPLLPKLSRLCSAQILTPFPFVWRLGCLWQSKVNASKTPPDAIFV